MATSEETKAAAPQAPTRAGRYEPGEIEPRWRRAWAEAGLYTTDLEATDRPKFYMLTMYPYPSGDLHVGHWYAMTPPDAIARFQRMQGRNAFLPMGFDAFGLPAENAAIDRGVDPYDWTLGNIERMRSQMRLMGSSFDWSAEVVTCEPEFYRWNQWFFLKMHERGMAYRARTSVDWCPRDKATLAREQVIGPERRCWRCGTPCIKRDLESWFYRITAYADELLSYEGLDWPERTKIAQQNWIGRSEGAEIVFPVAADEQQAGGHEIRVFTTRPDTLFGATFMVLAPEHELVATLTHPEHREAVEAYVAQARRETEIERLSADRVRTGVPTGSSAINPATGERVPVWVADYVVATYGTGGIMAVPAHDERDYGFAVAYGLPIRQVVALLGAPSVADEGRAYVAHQAGEVLLDSGRFSGLPADEGGRAIVDWLAAEGGAVGGSGRARPAVGYRLRDWNVSRQRYWGTPIPIVYCRDCGTVPVPEEQLPVLLPRDVAYKPTGESPLKTHAGFIHTECPSCGGPAERDTDTLDTFVDSAWYWFRYLSPHLDDAPIDRERVAHWTPVDLYTGGTEHTVLHLLYFRFFTKVMNDLGLIDHREPALRLRHQGQILAGEGGERMSKSRGNVEAPDELVGRYGADALRLFLMFLGPWEEGAAWNGRGIEGVSRFLHRVWAVAADPHGVERGDPQAGTLPVGETVEQAGEAIRRAAHRTLRLVTEENESFRFNVMVAHLMELTNVLMRYRGTPAAGGEAWYEAIRFLILMLAPAAPHIAEELWQRRLAAGGVVASGAAADGSAATGWSAAHSVHRERWPSFDAAVASDQTLELPIQVNGKLRDRVTVPVGLSQDAIEEIVLGREKIAAALDGRTPRRVIHVPGRLVNLVV
jgi:leucyl-tRNA synthetase